MRRQVRRDAARDERVLEALRMGNTRGVAAAYAGYGRSTLYRYLKKCPDFCNRVEAAEAEAEALAVAMIFAAAAKGTWRAAAWWLERRRSAAYGRNPVGEKEEEGGVLVILPHNGRGPIPPELAWEGELPPDLKGE